MTEYAIPYECCCGASAAWTVFAEFKFYDKARCDGTLCLEQIITVFGSGTDTGTVTIVNRFRDGLGAPCTLNRTITQTIPVTGRCGLPFQLFQDATAGIGEVVGFLGLRQAWNSGGPADEISGGRYDDCTRFEASERVAANLRSPNPCAGRLALMRASVTVVAVGCSTPAPACGSCCCRGDCYDGLTATACAAMGGRYKGDGTSCLTIICDPLTGTPKGACCLPDGTCRKDVTRGACETVLSGVWQGEGSKCEDVNCPPPPIRACCLAPNFCLERTQAECKLLNGEWFSTAHCGDPGVCVEVLGSCCTTSGSGDVCNVMTLADCNAVNGRWFIGGNCENGDATCNGACCLPIPCGNGRNLCVTNVGANACALQGGTWLGGGTVCSGDCNDLRCTSQDAPPQVGTRRFF